MAVYKATGIIIKRVDFGEADKLLTVFTRERGKITVIAKGVRKITSRRGGSIELFNKCKMLLAQGRNFDVLTEVEVLEGFLNVREDLETIGKVYRIGEVTDRLTAEGQESRNIFILLENVLKVVSKKRGMQLLLSYEVKLLKELGFWSYKRWEEEEKVRKVLRFFEHEDFATVERLMMDDVLLERMDNVLRLYIEEVIERDLASGKFLKKI